MAYLPAAPLTLTGGCYCEAIKYRVSIPALEHRPLVPGALETPLVAKLHSVGHEGQDSSHTTTRPQSQEKVKTVPTRLPLIPLDHCEICRRILGGIIQCWIISPQTWVEWDLLLKSKAAGEEVREKFATPNAVYAGTATESYLTHFHSSPDNGKNGSVTRSFCSRCGTHLSYAWKASPGPAPEGGSGARSLSSDAAGEVGKALPELVNVTAGSLDTESIVRIQPDRQGWWEFGVDWVKSLLRSGDGGMIRHNGDVGAALED